MAKLDGATGQFKQDYWQYTTRVGTLTELEKLGLSSNHLVGKIPKEFGQLSLLFDLRLDDNQLSGQIPPELGSCLI